MNSRMWGMNPDTVTQLSGDLDRFSERVTGLEELLSNRLEASEWVGRDRDRFAETWENQHVQALRAIAEQLRQASLDAAAEARQQESASR